MSNFIGGGNEGEGGGGGGGGGSKERTYTVLQSLGMRRYETYSPDDCGTVGCHAGSMDLMYGPLGDGSGKSVLKGGNSSGSRSSRTFCDMVRDGKDQTNTFTSESKGPQEAVRVFDFATRVADLNNLVHLTAKSKSSIGRAYSDGVTNAGVYERQKGLEREDGQSGGKEERETLKVRVFFNYYCAFRGGMLRID